MSINSILNVAGQAMNAQQLAVQINSQNIANATTEGYSRQRLELQAALPTVFPYGSVGTGVQIAGVTRARDALLDTAYRGNAAGSAAANASNTALSQIQEVFGEPSTTGLSASLDAFFSAWSDLSSDPTNSAAKTVVRQSGQTVAQTLNQFATQLSQLDQNNREGMNADVGQINMLAKQIAELNNKIVTAQSNGQPANDLSDQRDVLLDQLTSITGGQVVPHANGSVAVYAGGAMIVDDTTVKTLEMYDGQPPVVRYAGSTTAIPGIGGSLGAKLDISATQVPTVMSKLDALASNLVQSVNAIHSAGTTFSGNPPVAGQAGNFFDVTIPPPAGGDPRLTALGIRLSPTLAGPDDVAAAGPGATGPGDNGTALALANLRTTALSLTSIAGTTTATLGDYFNQTVGTVATAAQQAQDEATVQQTLTTNADNRRQSVSGVSTDEELIDIIQHQHAYQAAARLVSVVNSMMDSLVSMVQ
jgi:flagellar hook-associated protein 1 FlgK